MSQPIPGPATPADQVFAGLSDEQRLGQIVATSVGHHSSVMVTPPAVDDPDADAFWARHAEAMKADQERVAGLIATYGLGGVCYFPGRLDGNPPAEVAATVAAMEAAAAVPLLVSTDQEGGRVARLRGGFSLFGSALSMAATGDPEAVGEAAFVTGTELRAVGISQVCSPVCDLNVNPANPVIGTRSYGASVAAVAPYLAAVVAGFRRAGVASTAKHFPGHGDTATDSHLALPVVTHSLESWRSDEGASFAAAIAAGVDCVMSGHVVMTAVDDAAGTFSRPVLTGLLREELGFTGLVVTDALGMSGARVSEATMYVDAVNAGVDQLLMPADVPVAMEQLSRAVADGRLTRERVHDACRRVLIMKARLGLLPGPEAVPRPGLGTVGRHGDHAVALAASAVTVRGPAPEPLAVGDHVRLLGPATVVSKLAPVLVAAGLVPADDGRRLMIIGAEHPDHDQLAATDLAVLTGLPYAASSLPDTFPVLLTYGDNATHLAALARVLLNPSLATGTCPVPLLGTPAS